MPVLNGGISAGYLYFSLKSEENGISRLSLLRGSKPHTGGIGNPAEKEDPKDKLHQAYLRRKANGTQKRYEEKINVKKKAEIKAKKATIRAEDMEKGVFIPASSLPKNQPPKAPMSARAAM